MVVWISDRPLTESSPSREATTPEAPRKEDPAGAGSSRASVRQEARFRERARMKNASATVARVVPTAIGVNAHW